MRHTHRQYAWAMGGLFFLMVCTWLTRCGPWAPRLVGACVFTTFLIGKLRKRCTEDDPGGIRASVMSCANGGHSGGLGTSFRKSHITSTEAQTTRIAYGSPEPIGATCGLFKVWRIASSIILIAAPTNRLPDRYAHSAESTFLDSNLSACWLGVFRSSADRDRPSLRGRLYQAVCP